MATTTRTRNDYSRWRRALNRALAADLAVIRLADSRACVSSATTPGAGYLTDGIRCECQAARAGDPICCHRAAYWHYVGRLKSDAQLIADAEAAMCAVFDALGVEARALFADDATRAAATATVDAAFALLNAAADELKRAGITWDGGAFWDSLAASGEREPVAPAPALDREEAAIAAACGACHVGAVVWRSPDSGLGLCASCLRHAETFGGYEHWSETAKAARADALHGEYVALAAD